MRNMMRSTLIGEVFFLFPLVYRNCDVTVKKEKYDSA